MTSCFFKNIFFAILFQFCFCLTAFSSVSELNRARIFAFKEHHDLTILDLSPEFVFEDERGSFSSQDLKTLINEGLSSAERKRVKHLNISNQQLEELPEDVIKLENLEVLIAKSSQIHKLPAQFKSLNKLTQVDLSNNLISVVPNDLFSLPQLIRLSLKQNPFKLNGEKLERINSHLPFFDSARTWNGVQNLNPENCKKNSLVHDQGWDGVQAILKSWKKHISQIRKIEENSKIKSEIYNKIDDYSQLISLIDLYIRSGRFLNRFVFVCDSDGVLRALSVLDFSNPDSIPKVLALLSSPFNLGYYNNSPVKGAARTTIAEAVYQSFKAGKSGQLRLHSSSTGRKFYSALGFIRISMSPYSEVDSLLDAEAALENFSDVLNPADALPSD